ncbi:hypothetical protein BANRA_04025 [Acinetobacter baumannii]|nr:hypothetical protein BANRA_04025 [Acinetobacter baumannii]
MTTTVNSDMIIYNQLAQTAYLERLQDNLNVFNQASNGAIVYRNEIIEGDFNKEAFYKVGGSIKHRDVNSTAKVVPEKIGSGESVGVKVPYKYGPMHQLKRHLSAVLVHQKNLLWLLVTILQMHWLQAD